MLLISIIERSNILHISGEMFVMEEIDFEKKSINPEASSTASSEAKNTIAAHILAIPIPPEFIDERKSLSVKISRRPCIFFVWYWRTQTAQKHCSHICNEYTCKYDHSYRGAVIYFHSCRSYEKSRTAHIAESKHFFSCFLSIFPLSYKFISSFAPTG